MTLTSLSQRDPRLRQVCAPISKAQLRERDLQLEIDALLDFVYGVARKDLPGARRDLSRPNTVGLSANQVGIMKRICVADLSIGRHGYSDVHVLINPQIISESRSQVERPEGCVNFSCTWGITRRSRSVKVAALDRSGNELELKLTGWPAVLIQHEIDHLNGYLFIDRLIDPTKAHLVEPKEYAAYRKVKPEHWTKCEDVTSQLRDIRER